MIKGLLSSLSHLLYEKSCPCQPSQKLALPMSLMHCIYPDMTFEGESNIYLKNVDSPTASHPVFEASESPAKVNMPRVNSAISHINGLQKFVKKCNKKLSCPGWLGMEGTPSTMDNLPSYKQALRCPAACTFILFFAH